MYSDRHKSSRVNVYALRERETSARAISYLSIDYIMKLFVWHITVGYYIHISLKRFIGGNIRDDFARVGLYV